MTKPIRIPRDLMPGDIGVRRDGTQAKYTGVSMFANFPFRFDHPIDGSYTVTKYGFQATPKMPQPRDIIRIIRIARKPKKARVDKDAKYLNWMAERQPVIWGPAQVRRIRAIARRLENMS